MERADLIAVALKAPVREIPGTRSKRARDAAILNI